MGRKDRIAILKMLYVLHQENEAIATLLMQQMCYPQDFDMTCKKTFKAWDKTVNEIYKEIEHDGRRKDARNHDDDGESRK